MLVGFQRVEDKIAEGIKPEPAFVAVFGTRKPFKRQTYADHLKVLKQLPRAEVENMLDMGSTWADARKAAGKYRML